MNKSWQARVGPYGLSLLILGLFLLLWQSATHPPKFDPSGKTEDQLTLLEFNGDIVRDASGKYIFNPDKVSGLPGPMKVLKKARIELGEAFTRKGTNDHGIGLLVFYTIKRFLAGFMAGSVVAILLGILVGLSKPLYVALNPFIQVLKPISPLAWMPLMLYSVKDPVWTAILVVFMASLWPTVANTAFGVNAIRKDYLQVAALLEMSYWRRLFTVILPAAAPAIIAGLRISFGSALVAVVPAEMLLGELGAGYLTWTEWNNLDISGVIFAILVVGVVGYTLDYAFGRLAQIFNYSEV
ncbi:MAG TPA: ABC transporter permease subunit [Verrucomicrobiae bacterium]|nr:ABC transporter permease subunit [Verrucomicrobiae bacterium]